MSRNSRAARLSAPDVMGAFGDCALLLPVLTLLTSKISFSPVLLFLSVGILYLVSGYLFKVPMAVQPLKALVASALAGAATIVEVRVAAVILALLLLMILNSRKLLDTLKSVPRHIVHGLQLGLGILLLVQCISILGPLSWVGWVFLLGVATFAMREWVRSPLLFGIVAMIGLLWAFTGAMSEPAVALSLGSATQSSTLGGPRFWVLMSLVLPQLALTLGNSVLATEQVCKRYFGERAGAVTHERLLKSIGIGNLVSASLGGLPFCHGSGGVTAHYVAGARTQKSNYVAGVFFVVCAILASAGQFSQLNLNRWIVAGLLSATAVTHMKLAQSSLQKRGSFEFVVCVSMAVTTLVTRNLLWASLIGLSLVAVHKLYYPRPSLMAERTSSL